MGAVKGGDVLGISNIDAHTHSGATGYGSLLSRKYHTLKTYHFDDFFSDAYTLNSPPWTITGTGGYDFFGRGILRINAAGLNGTSYLIYRAIVEEPDKNPKLISRLRLGQVTRCDAYFGIYSDANNLVDFYVLNAADASTWYARCRYNGNETILNTGVTVTTAFKYFEIVMTSSTVNFYIDSTLVASINTNIPGPDIISEMSAYWQIISRPASGSATNYLHIDSMEWECDPPDS